MTAPPRPAGEPARSRLDAAWTGIHPASGSAERDVAEAVQRRYSAAAHRAEPGLCCPVEVDPAYLDAIPSEVIERDYGCGDPVSGVRPGETVLDLGSGAGKVCFIAAQVVGAGGRVIGVDANPDMLVLARSAQQSVAARLGYSNVTFVRARIEDLGVDLEFLDEHLAAHPISSSRELESLRDYTDRLRQGSPVVTTASVDVVISNCVLNLVAAPAKQRMFTEIARVLRPGGRAVISDIVANRDVPPAMQADPELWSGCYSGAMREDRFIAAFVDSGLLGVRVVKRNPRPWQSIGGVEFRSITVTAHKPSPLTRTGETSATVLYPGPFTEVVPDGGPRLRRGVPVQVSGTELAALQIEPYRSQIQLLDSSHAPDPEPQRAAPGVDTGPAGAGTPTCRCEP